MTSEQDEEVFSGRLFLWGKASRSDKEISLTTPTPSQFFFSRRVTQVATGLGFTAVLTEDQEVYTIGSKSWFSSNATDSADTREEAVHWKELSGKGVVQIACGQNFVAAVTMVGLLYTWGTGTFGQLGLGEEILKQSKSSQLPDFKLDTPTIVETLLEVEQIACGEECMAAISKGKLYTWGKGYSGCLGHGDEADVFQPKKVVALEEEVILQIKCGASHMACLTENKEIFTWGNNFLGPLGRILGKQKDSDFTPKVVELVQTGALVTEENLKGSDEVEFIQVECLKYNTIALTSEGQVFSCGKGGSDGSGHGESPHTLLCLIEALKGIPIRFLASCSTSHVAAVADDDSVYIWGNGEEGKLGLGNTENQLVPVALKALKGRQVFSMACGETHTAAVLDISESDSVQGGSITSAPSATPAAEKKPTAELSDEEGEVVVKQPKSETPESKPKQETPAATTTSSSSATSTGSPVVDMAGYLNKKGEKGLVKLWRKRWFKIEADSIDYYDHDKAPKKNGSIELKDCMDILPGAQKLAFNLVTRSGRIYELQALSQPELEKWTSAIKSKISKFK